MRFSLFTYYLPSVLLTVLKKIDRWGVFTPVPELAASSRWWRCSHCYSTKPDLQRKNRLSRWKLPSASSVVVRLIGNGRYYQSPDRQRGPRFRRECSDQSWSASQYFYQFCVPAPS